MDTQTQINLGIVATGSLYLLGAIRTYRFATKVVGAAIEATAPKYPALTPETMFALGRIVAFILSILWPLDVLHGSFRRLYLWAWNKPAPPELWKAVPVEQKQEGGFDR